MIQANELRIGNWMMFAPKKNGRHSIIPRCCKVVEIAKDRFVVEDLGLHLTLWPDSEETTPIPLTPEILEKAGFKLLTTDDADVQFYYMPYLREGDNGMPLGLFVKRFEEAGAWLLGFQPVNGSLHAVNTIYSLHELQNAWHAIARTELNIQL